MVKALSPEQQAECHELLAANEDTDCKDHVAEVVERQGRHLVYVVTTGMAIGPNRIALPAQILASNRKQPPSIVRFEVTEDDGGEVVIPDETRLELFPEARSVRIRFQSDPRYQ